MNRKLLYKYRKCINDDCEKYDEYDSLNCKKYNSEAIENCKRGYISEFNHPYGLEDLIWWYRGLIKTMEEHPATYSMEEKRTEVHLLIEAYFPGCEKALRKVLHNMDKYFPSNYHPRMFEDIVIEEGEKMKRKGK